MFDAFLSYARADDKAFVSTLYHRLSAGGFRIWYDQQEMPSRGETFLREIQHAIDDSERVIAVVGPAAVASEYVRAEWDYAQLFSKAVVPILRTGASLEDIPEELRGQGYELIPTELRHYHCPDFRMGRDQDAAFAELERILRQLVTAPSIPHHVPQLPPHFLPRREFLSQIAETLLVDAFHPVTIAEAGKQTTLVHGLPGAGKSVIASAFARAVNIRRTFRDGVMWLSVTQSPDLLRQWKRIGKALGDVDSHYADLDTAEDRLGDLLRDRECLVVMDDVWEARHVTPIWNALGPRCRLLLTAREKGIGRTFGAASCEADVLSPHAALSLLSQSAEIPLERLPDVASRVASECGYLPLALAICGAMVKATVPWKDIVDALGVADLSFLGHEIANYPYPHVMRALQASVDFLGGPNPDAPSRYYELAVFVPERQIPEPVVLKLWCHDGFGEREARKLLADFDSASLLRVTSGDPRIVELHDLQWDYVRSHTADARPLHRRLVAAYGPAPTWPSLADDKYFFDKIAAHVLKAELRHELLFLVSRQWMQAQFGRTLNHGAFAADLDLIISHLGAERPLDIIILLRACLVRATVGALSTRIPPAALIVLAMCDDVRKALGFAELIVEPERRVEAFTGIAATVHAQGDVALTRTLLSNALLAALRVVNRDEPDAPVTQTLRAWGDTLGWRDLRTVPSIVSDARDRDRLRRLVASVLELDPSYEPPLESADESDVWERAAVRVRHGALEEAFSLIATQEYRQMLPPPWKGLWKAMLTLDSVLPAIVLCDAIRNEKLRNNLLEELAADLATAGRSEEALAAARAIVKRSDRDMAVYRAACALEEGGRHLVAANTVDELSSSWKAMGLAMLARSRARSGALDEARLLARNSALEQSAVDDDDRVGLITSYLAEVFVRTGDHDEAEGQITRGHAYAERSDHEFVRAKVIEGLAPALARIGRASDAIALIDRFELRSWVLFEVVQPLAAALIDVSEFEAATQLVPRLASHDRSRLLLELAPLLVRHGQYDLAIGSLRFLEHDFERHKVLEPLTKALLDAHAYREALAALETVEPHYRSRVAEPIVLGLVEAGEHQLALEAARLADSAGLETQIVVHMARTSVARGRTLDLQKISTLPIPDHMRSDVLKALALAWRDAGALDTALSAAGMANESDRSDILTELVLAAVNAGDLAWARGVLPQIERDMDRSKARAALVESYLKADHLDDGFDIARAMPVGSFMDDPRTDALFHVLSRALGVDRLDVALAVAASLNSGPAKARALADIARLHAAKGEMDAARVLLQDVLALSLTVPLEDGRDRALSTLGELLAGAGQTEQALAVANCLKGVPRASVLGAVAIGQAATNVEQALETAGSLEAFEEFGVRWVEADVFLGLAAACVGQHRTSAARDLAERGREKSLAAFAQQDAFMQVMTDAISTRLAAAYGIFRQTGMTDAVDAIFRDREDTLKYKRDDILSALAAEEARSAVGGQALVVAKGIVDARKKVETLTAIAGCLVSRNDLRGAVDVAREAMTLIASVSVDWQRVEALGQVAVVLVRAGDAETWTKDLEATINGSEKAVAASAVSLVALALAQTGRHQAAREWLERIPQDRTGDVQGAVALTLVTLGETAEGVAVADSLLRSVAALQLEYDIKTTALVYASSVFVTTRDPARAFQCLAACDFDREKVKDALPPVIAVWQQDHESRGDPERHAAYWYDLCCSQGETWQQRAALAAVSGAFGRTGRVDIGTLLLARAIADARFEGRLAVFDVLRRAAPLLPMLNGGRALLDVSLEVVDVEGWWQLAPS